MSISLYIKGRVSYLLPSSCSLIQVFFSFCRGVEIATAVQPPTDLVTLAVSIHHLLFQLLLMSSLLIYYRSLHYGDWTLRLPLLSAPHFVYVVFSSWLHVGLSINITCAVSSDLENSCHSLLHLDIRCCHTASTVYWDPVKVLVIIIVALSTVPVHLLWTTNGLLMAVA